MSTTLPIVTVNTSINTSPQPSTLQQRGAAVSQGATTNAVDSLTLLSQASDLDSMLASPIVIASLAWASDVVTLTTATPHGWTNVETIPIVVAGASPSGYNGTFPGTITGTTTLTYPLSVNPGAEVTPGSVTLYAVTELQQMVDAYFAGSGVRAFYVLELGEGTANDGVASLTTVIADIIGTPDQIYAYLVPREWDNNASFLTLVGNNVSPTSKLYFYVTTTLANKVVYSGPAYKCVFALVEAPGASADEFSCASPFGTALKQSPSSTVKVPPMSYAPAYGVTPYPLRGNQTTLQELAAANVNWIGTGAEGGITTDIILQGLMSDGNFWNFWYAVDWAQINLDLAIANEVINGAANMINPLYYNQDGINRLQNRGLSVLQQGVAAGLLNGQVIGTKLPQAQFIENYNAGNYNGQIVLNAEPYLTYTAENPSDYGIGKYAGMSAIVIPQSPFLNIFFNLTATTLVSV